MTNIWIVCGGRDYQDRNHVFSMLDHMHHEIGIDKVLHGGASGADRFGYQWCRDRGIECTNYPANWKAHGRAAGPIRNQQMIDEGKATHCIAFEGGRGTWDMVQRAMDAGLTVFAPNDMRF